jgi:hypothetical protein
VDAAGAVWMTSPTGLVRWTATLGVQSSAHPGSVLARGDDGHVYALTSSIVSPLPLPTGISTLRRIDGLTQVPIVASWSGDIVFDFAADGQGGYFLATANGIQRLGSGASSPAPHATGIAGAWHRSVVFDPATGRLYAADAFHVVEITGASTSVLLADLPGPAMYPWEFFDLVPGWHGHVLVLRCFLEHAIFPLVASLKIPNGSIDAFTATTVAYNGWEESFPSLATGPGGEAYLLTQGVLYQITGQPLLLSAGVPAPGLLQIDLDGPPNAPFLLAADQTAGQSWTYPGIGVFHTSLGQLPTFVVLLDGLGAFLPANPAVTLPWSLTVSVPAPPLGLPYVAEGYALGPAAANGWLHISNAAVRQI